VAGLPGEIDGLFVDRQVVFDKPGRRWERGERRECDGFEQGFYGLFSWCQW